MGQEMTIYGQGSPVAARRALAKMPEVLRSLEPLERTVFDASVGRTVSEYGQPELTVELSRSLRIIARDIGLRDTEVDNYMTVRLASVLTNYYGGFTLRDFRLAFEMSVTGELDDYLPKRSDGTADRGHYQNFSTEYVCRILNAYRARRAQVLRKAAEAAPRKEEARDPDAERLAKQSLRRCLLEDYAYFCETGAFPAISPIAKMLYYHELAGLGFAPEVQVTERDQRAVFNEAVRDYLARGYLGDATRLKDAGPGADELAERSYIEARTRALRETFARMKEGGIDLKNYFVL